MQSKRIMANPDVSCRQEPDGALFFNPDTGAALATNSVGHLIWQALAQPRTPEEIAAHLMEICTVVPADQVAADVETFLRSLQPRGFIGQVLDGNGRFETTVARQPSPVQGTLSLTPDDDQPLRFYRGSSMWGAFRPGDYLVVEPAPLAAIQPGDVVLYRGRDPEGESDDVVHRVVDVAPGGLVTRGDNNPQVDNVLVTADNLLGRVTHFERGDRVYAVRGGRPGLLVARLRRARRFLWWHGKRLIVVVVRWPYRALRRSGLVRRLWRPAIVRIALTTENGPLVKHVSNGRTVAWWRPETGRFRCRRPYDLIIGRPGRQAQNMRGE